MIGKKGLFGKNPYGMAEMPMPGVVSGFGGGTFNMDGTQATPMQQEITYTPKAQAIMSGEAPMPPKQGGGWKDILLGALGGAADGAATFFGGQPLIAQNQQMQRMMAMRQAEEQRRRAAELADFRTQLQIRQEFEQPEQAKPRFEQDGAGNLWALDPVTGRPLSDTPVFIDRTERIINQNGALIRIPNPWAQGGGTAPQPSAPNAPDTLPADFFKGGTAGNGGGSFRR